MSNNGQLHIISVGERCIRRFSEDMKQLMILFATFLISQTAYPQIHSGTVIFVNSSQDEVTIAADSRMTNSVGEHDDTECKISAFGNNFVFTMAGVANKTGAWNAHAIARESWKATAKTGRLIEDLTAISHSWIMEMESRYADPAVVEGIEKMNPDGDPVLATAVFAASNPSSGVVVTAVDIDFDREIYRTTRTIKFTDDVKVVPVPYRITMGHSEIMEEFDQQSSIRAKEYMAWFRGQISSQSISGRRAMAAAKLIELSILLHPKNIELGFPIDVMQLDKTSGVRWIQRKKNCPED